MAEPRLENDWDPGVMVEFVEIDKRYFVKRGEKEQSIQEITIQLVSLQKKVIVAPPSQSATEITETEPTVWKDPGLKKGIWNNMSFSDAPSFS